MDPEFLATSTSNAKPRKVRFAPKAPPKREQKPVLPKAEKTEDDLDDAKAEQLLRRLHETSVRAKVERKAGPTKVAFGFGGSATSLRSYGAPKNINRNNQGSSFDGGAVEKEYTEPWDYYTYYPVTLPLRRPYSGNPEVLDKEEFEEDPVYDEDATNPALELGLLEESENSENNNMFFLQLPATVPAIKQSEVDNNAKGAGPGHKQPHNLEALPAGLMGKMLVYRSGAVKLKLEDTLYDVSAGLNCVFAQDVVAMNTEDRHCCNMGELNKRAIITPDIDCILDSISDF